MGVVKFGVRCRICDYYSSKWLGKCPDCGSWDTFEEIEEPVKGSSYRGTIFSEEPKLLSSVPSFKEKRYSSGFSEFDRILGGGVVPGSLILLGGEPGIGKSTLLLQVSSYFTSRGPVLLVSGEESSLQVRLRAERISSLPKNLYFLSETNIEKVAEVIKKLTPHLVMIDSIQAMFHPEIPSSPGSVSQLKETASYLLELAKGKGFPIFLVGHVTKEGMIAGPKVLEHLVDTVLYFEGDSGIPYRLIRAVKNRYGATGEVALFEMGSQGLKEVKNPSGFLLGEERIKTPGRAVVPVNLGARILLVEIQVLVAPSNLSIPRRLVSGLDYNRTLLILALLEKRAGFRLSSKDVFVSVVSGLKVTEPAADLGLTLAVASAYKDLAFPPDFASFGEVGLGGEIRKVSLGEQRTKEAERLGFKKIITPAQNLEEKTKIKVLPAKTVKEALNYLE